MEIVKKNMTSIIMGVVAILAVVGVYVWPVPGLYVKLAADMEKSDKVGLSVASAVNTSVQAPNINPDADPVTISGFPSPEATKNATDALAKFKAEAARMYQTAIDLNKHSLLVDGELPKPGPGEQFNYQKKYGEVTTSYARWADKLNFTARPTPQEITDAKAANKADLEKQILTPDYSQPEVNGVRPPTAESRSRADEKINATEPKVELQKALEHALQHSVYLEAGALKGIDTKIGNVGAGFVPAPSDKIWDTQLALWCIDDVTNAIADCNAKYCDPEKAGSAPVNNIVHNPIKQIESIGAPLPVVGGDLNSGVSGPIARTLAVSDTGRACNGLYDVVTFPIRLVVDAEKLPLIVREIQDGQFITVEGVQVLQVVDPAISAASDYRFGTKPCIEVDLQIEELFMKDWTKDFLPDSRKAGLGGAAAGGNIDNGGAAPDQGATGDQAQ